MKNVILQYVAEVIIVKSNMSFDDCYKMVIDSFLPELYDESPDYIHHYDAEYWADEILDCISLC